MRSRLFALSSVLVFAAACSSQPAQTPAAQSGAPAAAAPGAAPAADSASGTPMAAPAATSAASPAGAQAASTPMAAAPAAPAGSAAAAAPAAPPAPMMMEMTVPAGTALEITLDTPVASDTSKVEDAVRGKVAKAIAIDGMTTIPAGSVVMGTVVEANPSARVKGRASITIRFNRVVVANTPYTIQTARISREAAATKGEDAKKVGIGAGAGALIGAIAGGKKGAAIGTAVGGGAGAGAVVATKGKEIGIAAGATVKTTISESVKINAPM
jgi:hypothetical protein